MKSWQKDRNYRKYKNPDGTFTYIITVDGIATEVDAVIYKAYSQADRRERYTAESEEGLLLSLERMAEDGTQLSYLTDSNAESAESVSIREIQIERMTKALASLPPDEQELITLLFFDSVSAREIAKSTGVYHNAIAYRRDKILDKLRQILLDNIPS
jgi:RNA polymerase sigma factor (sigma-70 family)